MKQLTATATIQAPANLVWEKLADVGTIADWHPGVATSTVLTANAQGLGAARRVELYQGGSAVETVTALEDTRSIAVTMSDHSMPLSVGIATFAIESETDGQTVVTMTMDYAMKFGPIGWLLNALILRRVMNQLLPSVLAGLNHHLVTGETIGEGWKAEAN